MEDFQKGLTQATTSAYFMAGIAVGLFPFHRASDWAFSVIEASEAPSIEIIEVATARDRNSAMDALRSASCGGDQLAAGRLLLAEIVRRLEVEAISADEAVTAAVQVSLATGLPDEICYAFDGLADAFNLAAMGVYDTTDELELDLMRILRRYVIQP